MRLGVLGCSGFARRRMLPAVAASPDVDLVAVASRDGSRAAEVAAEFGCRAVQGYAALLERDDVDAVYVPLPAALHAEWAGAALRAGKHVLAEKPLTTDAGRTAALFREAAGRNLALMENVLFVHHAQHAAVAKLVADGAIGEPRAFQAAFTVPRRPGDDIRLRPELGGGALWDTGVYPLRAALHLLGDGLRVAGASLASAPGAAVDTSGAALLVTPDGVSAQLTFGLDHGYRSEYELTGSRGRITVGHAFTPPADHRPAVRLEGPSGTTRLDLPADDQIAAGLAAFAEAVRRGGAPARDSLRQAALLDDIRAAAG